MRLSEDYESNAPVALPPIHLPRGLVNRLDLDTESAEWASVKLAYVLEVGLEATQPNTAAPVRPTPTPAALLACLTILLDHPDSLHTILLIAETRGCGAGKVALELATKMTAAGIR